MASLVLDLPRPLSLRSAKVEEGFLLQAQGVRALLLDLSTSSARFPVAREFGSGAPRLPYSLFSSLEVEEVEEVEEVVVKPLQLQRFSLLDLDASLGLEVEEVERLQAAIAARRDRWLLGAILGA